VKKELTAAGHLWEHHNLVFAEVNGRPLERT
jgi:hypothetical protein